MGGRDAAISEDDRGPPSPSTRRAGARRCGDRDRGVDPRTQRGERRDDRHGGLVPDRVAAQRQGHRHRRAVDRRRRGRACSGPAPSQTSQQFQFVDSGGGYYRLRARHSGKVIDVSNRSTADGANIVQWADNNGTNQQFRVVDTDSGYVKLLNRNSGKALDLWGWSTADGARISQYTDTGGANQQWQLVRVRRGRRPTYAGYLFSYFTGEGTANGEQVYFGLSQGNDPTRWRQLNGGQPVLTSTVGTARRARPVHHPVPAGRPVLPDRHRPAHLRQRQLGRRAAHRQQVHRGLGVHRPGELERPAPGPGLAGHRRQHVGARGLLRRRARPVRRVLGLEALRRRATPTTPATATTG